jgi:hypothetical protein
MPAANVPADIAAEKCLLQNTAGRIFSATVSAANVPAETAADIFAKDFPVENGRSKITD